MPPAQFSRAVEENDLPLSKPAERRATSLIGDFVAFARAVARFETAAAQTAPSSQPPANKGARTEPVENMRFDPVVGGMPSTAPIVQFNEPIVVGAIQPPSFGMTEVTTSPRQPLGGSVSRDALHLERPTEERPHAPIDHAHSSPFAHATERPVGDERPDLQVDQAPSMHGTVVIEEPNVVGAIPSSCLATVETAPALRRQPVDKPVSRNALPLEGPTQERAPAPIDLDHCPPVIENATEKPVGGERFAPMVDQPVSTVAFVPVDESNAAEANPSSSLDLAKVDAASILQPIAKPAPGALPLEYPAQKGSPNAIKDAHSLVVKKVVISEQKAVLVKQLLISEPTAAQVGQPSSQPSAKQGREKSVLDALSDPLVDQALSMIADDKPSAAGAVPPLSANGSGPVGPLRKPVDEPASRDILPPARPVQEISLIDHALSLVKGVVISERHPVLVKKVAISEFKGIHPASPSLQSPVDKPALEKPNEAPRAEALVDHTPSVIAVVPVDEANLIEAASPPSLSTAGIEPLSLPQPIDGSASKNLLRSLERPAQEEPPSIDRAHPEQPFVRQLSPQDRLDEELADIRRRVAAFKEHQQRSRREREEYHAATIAKASRTPRPGPWVTELSASARQTHWRYAWTIATDHSMSSFPPSKLPKRVMSGSNFGSPRLIDKL